MMFQGVQLELIFGILVYDHCCPVVTEPSQCRVSLLTAIFGLFKGYQFNRPGISNTECQSCSQKQKTNTHTHTENTMLAGNSIDLKFKHCNGGCVRGDSFFSRLAFLLIYFHGVECVIKCTDCICPRKIPTQDRSSPFCGDRRRQTFPTIYSFNLVAYALNPAKQPRTKYSLMWNSRKDQRGK